MLFSRSRLAPLTLGALVVAASAGAQAPAKRPLTFLDMQNMRTVGSPALSPDGKSMLYTLSVPDWRQARRESDIYVVSVDRGASSTRQLTFTKDKNETSPRWTPDGSAFVFLSDRDASSADASGAGAAAGGGRGGRGGAPTAGGGNARSQLYLMHADGGEARKLTDAREGVSSFAFSKDGKWLVYASGRTDEQQLFAIAVADLGNDPPRAVQWTRHSTGVGPWQFAPDSRKIYYVTGDTVDKDESQRMQSGFTVRIRNAETPVASLWVYDVDSKQETRLTRDTTFSVGDVVISPDSKWVAFHGLSANRYERNITEQLDNADLYLLDVAAGKIERLTNNKDIAESAASFSPDSKWIAFSAADDFTFMHNARVYLRRVDDHAGKWTKLGAGFDGDATVDFWSNDGKTIYFNAGIKATDEVMALDIATNTVRQLTHEKAAVRASQDEDTHRIIINYADPTTPPALFTVASVDRIGDRAAWTQLTDANPWVKNVALGEEQEIMWKSTDGRMVGGILIKPANYQQGKRYPLIVAIHGGPAAADVLGFNGGYGAQVYAGAGYAVLMPNYRGSTNYGERHKTELQGDYFTKGFQDIMTGVDHLIAQGVVDSTQMGALGWSAGGHWSNWILTHTNRFKAISTGAGTMNWISMYAQSDMQRVRQWYMGDKLPYDDFDHWFAQSPIKYIKNAKTPTMIHVVEGDPRVPRPQSEELHMALKRLGVPTELFVYPGASHGIPDPRNQLVKSIAEFDWMEKWVRGKPIKFNWKELLKTLDDSTRAGTRATATTSEK